MGKEMAISVFFDGDHAHDKVMGCSISGVVVIVGARLSYRYQLIEAIRYDRR